MHPSEGLAGPADNLPISACAFAWVHLQLAMIAPCDSSTLPLPSLLCPFSHPTPLSLLPFRRVQTAGMTEAELKEAGFTAKQLREEGFTLLELHGVSAQRETSIFSVTVESWHVFPHHLLACLPRLALAPLVLPRCAGSTSALSHRTHAHAHGHGHLCNTQPCM